jgi:cytochrome P450
MRKESLNMKDRPSSSASFNAGPRICPGKEMVFSVMEAAAATIVYNYHVQAVETAL